MTTTPDLTVKSGSPLPRNVILLLLLVSVAPSLVWLAKVLLGLEGIRPDTPAHAQSYAEPAHMLMNTVGVCLAFFTGILCFAHYARTGEVTTPLLGIGLFCAGAIDLWRTLAAGGIIAVQTSQDLFQPFSWTLSRGFLALVLTITASLILLSSKTRGEENKARALRVAVFLGVGLAAIASALMLIAAQMPNIVHQLYDAPPNKVFFDVVPLVLFLFCGLYIMPTYYRWQPTIYSQALWLSCISLALAQVHFLLHLGASFADRSHVIDALVLIGYLVPLAGMLLDYDATYRRNELALRQAKDDLLVRTQSETATSREREFTDALLATMTEPACILDSSLRVTRVNPAFASLAGLSTPLVALGKTLPNLLGGHGQTHAAFGAKAVETNTPQTSPPVEFSAGTGPARIVAWHHHPIADANGRVVAVITTARPA